MPEKRVDQLLLMPGHMGQFMKTRFLMLFLLTASGCIGQEELEGHEARYSSIPRACEVSERDVALGVVLQPFLRSDQELAAPGLGQVGFKLYQELLARQIVTGAYHASRIVLTRLDRRSDPRVIAITIHDDRATLRFTMRIPFSDVITSLVEVSKTPGDPASDLMTCADVAAAVAEQNRPVYEACEPELRVERDRLDNFCNYFDRRASESLGDCQPSELPVCPQQDDSTDALECAPILCRQSRARVQAFFEAMALCDATLAVQKERATEGQCVPVVEVERGRTEELCSTLRTFVNTEPEGCGPLLLEAGPDECLEKLSRAQSFSDVAVTCRGLEGLYEHE